MEKIIQKAIQGEYLLLSLPYESVEYKHKWLVCILKSQYQVNGKKVQEIAIASILIDPLFWQSLGKTCGWDKTKIWLNPYSPKGRYIPSQNVDRWVQEAVNFHEINLTQEFEKAVEYLEGLID